MIDCLYNYLHNYIIFIFLKYNSQEFYIFNKIYYIACIKIIYLSFKKKKIKKDLNYQKIPK